MQKATFFNGLWPFLAGMAVLTLLSGCGDKIRPGEQGAPSASGSGLTDSSTPPGSGQASSLKTGKNLKKVIVRVIEKETGRPRAGAGVKLHFAPAKRPSAFSYKLALTTPNGEAVFEIPDSVRLMARSEYSIESREFTIQPEGDTEVTIEVPTLFEVFGRVLGPDGKGIAGATYFLARFTPGRGLAEKGAPLPGAGSDIDGYRRHYGYDFETEGETGADGSFRCTVNTRQTLIASAYAEGLACPEWRFVSFDTTSSQFEPVDISLLPKAHIHFRILDTKGRPLKDQVLKLFESQISRCKRPSPETIYTPYSLSLLANASGRAESDVPAGIELILADRLYFMEPLEGKPLPDPVRDRPLDTLTLASGETARLLVIPPSTVRLHGTIQDGSGNWLAGAQLLLPGINQLKTGEDGGFSLLIPYNLHRKIWYEVSKEGYRRVAGVLPEIGEGSRELFLEVKLERGEDVTLVKGPSLERAWLARLPDLASRGIVSLEGCELLPNPEGIRQGRRVGSRHFLFKGVEPGTYTLLVKKGWSHFASIENLRIERTETHAQELDLTTLMDLDTFLKEDGAALEGQISVPKEIQPLRIDVRIARNDLPLAGQDIHRNASQRRGPGMVITSASIAHPAFSFENLAPGRYVLAVAFTEWDTRIDVYHELKVEADQSGVSLAAGVMREYGSIIVTITDTKSNPLGGASLLLLDPLSSTLGQAGLPDPFLYSDKDGVIRLDPLPPGRYIIVLGSPEDGGFLFNARVEVKPGAESLVRVVIASRRE